MPTKSFYELAFGVDPGGARKCTHYIRADKEFDNEEDHLSRRMAHGELGDTVGVTVAWDRISVPSLADDVLTADDVFDVTDHHLCAYGHSDCEV